jgi:hypothetical protein
MRYGLQTEIDSESGQQVTLPKLEHGPPEHDGKLSLFYQVTVTRINIVHFNYLLVLPVPYLAAQQVWCMCLLIHIHGVVPNVWWHHHGVLQVSYSHLAPLHNHYCLYFLQCFTNNSTFRIIESFNKFRLRLLYHQCQLRAESLLLTPTNSEK